MKPRDRLRIAMQKSGRLTEPALELLKRCGLTFRQSRDKLFCFGEGEPVDLLLVRDDDIPGLIAQGVCDVGIVGRNVLGEFQLTAGRQGEPLAELRPLASAGAGCRSPCRRSWITRCRVTWPAGAWPACRVFQPVGEWLREQGVDAGVVTLAGSVEIAPKLGTADAICDLVQSGGTLVANQLRETDVLLQSEAVLAGPRTLPADERGDMLELLLKRLDGVIQVRESRAAAAADLASFAGGSQPGCCRAARSRPCCRSPGQADQLMLQALCRRRR
ncbi:ATP phosphoribosyltransferase [Rhodanobacter lindaniclasticus]